VHLRGLIPMQRIWNWGVMFMMMMKIYIKICRKFQKIKIIVIIKIVKRNKCKKIRNIIRKLIKNLRNKLKEIIRNLKTKYNLHYKGCYRNTNKNRNIMSRSQMMMDMEMILNKLCKNQNMNRRKFRLLLTQLIKKQ
jgi:hypothetical protein